MLGLYEKSMPFNLSWEQKLICTKQAGFDFLEISIDETDEKLSRLKSSKQERFEILNSIYKTGVPIKTMCLSGHRKYPLGSLNEETRKRSLEIMKDAIDFALDIGITLIQLAGYDVYYEQSNEQTKHFFLENLKKSTELASEKLIKLGFETMETDFMNTVHKAMKYVDLINSPYLNIYPDSGNLTNAALTNKEDVITDILTGRGHIDACHLKETVPNKFREIPFGEGHVDFKKIIEAMKGLGVRTFVAEFWYTGNENWADDLKLANEFLRSKF